MAKKIWVKLNFVFYRFLPAAFPVCGIFSDLTRSVEFVYYRLQN